MSRDLLTDAVAAFVDHATGDLLDDCTFAHLVDEIVDDLCLLLKRSP